MTSGNRFKMTPIVTSLGPSSRREELKTSASSIAEVVIALTIIALCFSVASLIFIRSINVSTRFQDIRKQTEIQSKIMESLYRDNDSIPLLEIEDITVNSMQDETDEKMNVIEFLGTDNRVIWKQQVIKNTGNYK